MERAKGKRGNGTAFFRGAAIISLGGFAAKAIGAAYRIPLTNALGAEGMGVYQMVFPLYTVLLTLSSTGVPAGISRLTAGLPDRDGRRIFRAALFALSAAGLVGSALLAGLGYFAARLQGRPDAFLSYLALSPSVFLVSAISCFRGYYQGKLNMLPTAFSQVLEQAAKLSVGLVLARAFLPDPARAAAGAAGAVTLSEVAALAYFLVRFAATEKRMPIPRIKGDARRDLAAIFRSTFPLALSALLIPFSQVADSFLVVNLVGRYSADATALYGLFSGAAMSLVNLPVSLAYGAGAAAIPLIAAATAKGDGAAVRERSLSAVRLTLFLSIPSAFYLYRYAGDVVGVLYGGLAAGDRAVAASLVRVSTITVVFLSLTQTLASVSVGQGRPFVPVAALAVGVAVKIVSSVILLSDPEFSVYGAAISANLCYLVAGTANLVYSIREGRDAVKAAGFAAGMSAASFLGVAASRTIPLSGVEGFLVRSLAAAALVLLLSLPLLLGSGAARKSRRARATTQEEKET